MRLVTAHARLAVLAAGIAGIACASASTPPGGPPDSSPPQVVSFSPDSGAVNFTGRAVIVRFDETISDRGTGASALEGMVIISPRDGVPRVSWDRNRIAVRPRRGFRPNTAYSITIAPGITDLRSNRSGATRTITFSTGPVIPAGGVAGQVFDWPGQQVARTAWIEAMRVADSVVFVTAADSTGAFRLDALSPGSYVVRGYVDQNGNRALDRTEIWDSVRVAVAGARAGGLELLLASRDTFPARLQSVTITDSVTLRLVFDKPLDPARPFGDAAIRVVRADSSIVPVARVVTAEQAEQERAAATPSTDSVAKAPPAIPPAPDTAKQPARPARAAPPTTLVVVLGSPLAPGTTYRVTATGIRSLLGIESTATRLLVVPARDTTRR